MKILVTYHSRIGVTKRMAELVAEGAREITPEVVLQPVDQLAAAELPNYDGIIIGSPTYYGTMSSEVKKLLDETVEIHGQLAGKAGGAFASAFRTGGGGETALIHILSAMLTHGMVVGGDALGPHFGPVAVGTPDDDCRTHCLELGARVARLAAMISPPGREE
jgi:NAD(P)H dehydrogenase (quinone)